ncbi:low temperature requirement protein A [Listeria kieliensis]
MMKKQIFEERKVSWLELFFDLIFVTAVSSTTHLFVTIDHHPEHTLLYFGEYLLMVTPMFWAWVGQTMFYNRFGKKISHPELFMLSQMFFLILMTASFDLEFADTFYTFIIGYAGIRLFTVIQYFTAAKKYSAEQKQVANLLGRLFLVGILISLSAIFFEGNSRFFIMYAGIFLDILLPLLNGKKLQKVPVHFPHLAERFGLFVIITFGETIVAITGILAEKVTDPYTLLYVFLSFVIISILWASYFHSFEHVVDQNRATNGQVFLYGHYFIIIAIMMLAANIHLLFLGHLNKSLLLLFLYGSVALFFLSKQVVFGLHKKAEIEFSIWKEIGLVGLLACFYLLNQLTSLPLITSLLSILICALLDLMIRFQSSKLVRKRS